MDSLEARFAALFNSYYGGQEIVSTTRSPEWMFGQVKEAAGIHFSSYKESEDVKNEDFSSSDIEANRVLSDFKPPAHLKAQWTKMSNGGGNDG